MNTNTIILHHGAHTAFTLHIGQCWTEDESDALTYGEHLGTVELDMSGLVVRELDEGYDRDEDESPGDRGQDYGADVIVYDDETPRGQAHTTYRIMTQRGVDAATII